MNFEELKERLLIELKISWDKIRESSLYIKFREFYDSLTPDKQKAFNITSVFVLGFIVFSIPLGYYSTSQELVLDFEAKRDLTRELISSTRETKKNPSFSNPPDLMQLQSDSQAIIQRAQLLPEQVLSVAPSDAKSSLLANSLQQGLLVIRLSKLNLKQVIDIGTELQNIHSGVKMTSFQMELHPSDTRYIDVSYTLLAVALPSATASEAGGSKEPGS